ncbi:hypothetical protein [Actinoallomurus sp. NPDC052274]|uniref:hypothetical protein n=1 Tax=Actinoallomurus sp. NPDC052274 TaxID=3155420 RepID=UPI003437C5D1
MGLFSNSKKDVRPEQMARIQKSRKDHEAAMAKGDEAAIKRAMSVSDRVWKNSTAAEQQESIKSSRKRWF